MSDDDALLTREEVAALFRVDPKTVSRWKDRLAPIQGPGRGTYYRKSEVMALRDSLTTEKGKD